MTGGDERAAVHQLIAAIADRPAALALLRTLLVSVGRVAAADIVCGALDFRRPVNAAGEPVGPRRERRTT